MSRLILFDDGKGLAPLTDLRASFELRTGAWTTLQRLTRQAGPLAAVFVPPRLAALLAERLDVPVNQLPDGDADELFTFAHGSATTLADLDTPADRELVYTLPGVTVSPNIGEGFTSPDRAYVGRVRRATLEALIADDFRVPPGIETRSACPDMPEPEDANLFRKLALSHDLLRFYTYNLDDDLATMVAEALAGNHHHVLDASHLNAVTIVGRNPVLAGNGVVVHPQVVFDTSAGPIAIEDGAEVRSMSVVVGPSYIGHGSVVTNHAHIRAHTVIGPMCKVGGEVNTCLFQAYANKAHGGYLGNSFVGEWVNLGAATVTSNLKNTYGEVRMQCDPDGVPLPTRMTHLGSVLGDHVKTAIGTRLMTGSCIHTGAMLATAGFPPKCVPPFVFLTDPDPDARYDIDRFLDVAETVMSRRGVELTATMRDVLRQLHD